MLSKREAVFEKFSSRSSESLRPFTNRCLIVPYRLRSKATVVIASTKSAAVETRRSVKFLEHDSEGYFTVHGTMEISAPAGKVYSILSDYNNCDRVYHNIRKSIVEDVKSLPGGLQQLTVTQTCTWSFLAFSGEFLVKLIVEQGLEGKTLDFKLIESSFMRAFKGKWLVKPSENGSNSAESCTVEHTLSVKPNIEIPKPFTGLAEGIFVHQVSKLFDDVSTEVRRSL